MGRTGPFGAPAASDRLRAWWQSRPETFRANVLLFSVVGVVSIGLVWAAVARNNTPSTQVTTRPGPGSTVPGPFVTLSPSPGLQAVGAPPGRVDLSDLGPPSSSTTTVPAAVPAAAAPPAPAATAGPSRDAAPTPGTAFPALPVPAPAPQPSPPETVATTVPATLPPPTHPATTTPPPTTSPPPPSTTSPPTSAPAPPATSTTLGRQLPLPQGLTLG